MKSPFLIFLTACLSVPLVAAPGVESAPPADAAALQTNRVTDFARSVHVDTGLRHPVYGDPSFDAFERLPGNPIHRGTPPFEWPVNGFLFHDPVGGYDYVYIGDYTAGYAARPGRCLLYRSTDGAKTWANLGVVLHPDAGLFDKNGQMPDVTVVYDSGRYHMVYDWGYAEFNIKGGLAYAWADKPEGPWHRSRSRLRETPRCPNYSAATSALMPPL